ncbi:hypothetical protein Aab01nite_01530 [Paractinoplanes abujensis]|uniref:Uncharacterized protein n=1 Tax=Paractinoplanes abujensis TaxID=882441 RepID=A0A7W7G2V1_9ACTN|nr:hypothetical protein [Actinoplanes abujensis]MBB4692021.1 hypothetical protein [Actinoplanes abujensis]GID16563.1 hypothetical protein Aab01nite_01530 [Actinoplanes abujensis]
MISRFSAGPVLDLLMAFAAAADAVVLLPGGPVMLTNEDQLPHLPEEFRPGAVVGHAAADVERILAEH